MVSSLVANGWAGAKPSTQTFRYRPDCMRTPLWLARLWSDVKTIYDLSIAEEEPSRANGEPVAGNGSIISKSTGDLTWFGIDKDVSQIHTNSEKPAVSSNGRSMAQMVADSKPWYEATTHGA